MSLPSPFQLLPRRAVETIVKHVAAGGRPLLGGIKRGTEECEKLLIPLLWVCQSFREVVYLRYCKTYKLGFFTPWSKVLAIRGTWPKCLQKNEYPTHLVAKELLIQLKPWMIFTGDALKRLSSEPYSGCSFPLVRSLTLNFISRTSQEDFGVRTRVAKANVDAFLGLLLQMTPVASEIVLEGGDLSSNFSTATKPQVAYLVAQLYQRYKRVVHHVHFSAEFTGHQLNAIQDLVHFDYTANNDSEQAFQLARQSASTLQSLAITFDKVVTISGLFQGTDNSYIVYTSLRSLSLCHTPALQSLYENGSIHPWTSYGKKERLPMFADVTPFPGLVRLSLDIDYPFGDDILFRGSGATLEYASLQLYPMTRGIIYWYKLFTHSSHPKLQCIITRVAHDPSPCKPSIEHFQGPDYFIGIGSHAQVHRALNIPQCKVSEPYKRNFDGFDCVRVLSLPGFSVGFSEAVLLFGAFPNLLDLYTKCPYWMWRTPDGIYHRDLRAYKVANRVMARRNRFKTWVFSDSPKCDRRTLVSCLRVVAMVSSALDCVSPQAGNSDIFMGDMDDSVVFHGLAQHSERYWRVITE
ncbi:hypothetical protein GGF41_001915 [Coemansia sp. RSA 2531]|nr:hypothetical protein GGF41_001915 [Coemansia sp. RSA 2531]